MNKKIYFYYYFYNDNNVKIEKNAIPETTQKAVKLSLDYRPGSLILNIAPVNMQYRDGYAMEEFIVFSNMRFLVYEMPRFAPKRAQAAADSIAKIADKIANIFLTTPEEQAKIKIFTLIQSIIKE
jgi:hypothetical protein